MHGDFSRDTFRSENNFSRVLMQQGRLIVDADWNEQSDIFLYQLRTFAADIIGWHGGPGVVKNKSGPLRVTFDNGELIVRGGRYYVDGILVAEGDPRMLFVNQDAKADLENQLLFLDVWERYTLAATNQSLLDPALDGIDSASRSEIRSVVRVLKTEMLENDPALADGNADKDSAFRKLLIKKEKADNSPGQIDTRERSELNLPTLAAWTNLNTETEDPCDDETELGYTGLENQLYRVEIHQGGTSFWNGKRVKDGKEDPHGDPALDDKNPPVTFKWSRDNGSVVYPVKTLNVGATSSVTLRTAWRDERKAISKNDWIEILATDDVRGAWDKNPSGTLVKVNDVQRTNEELTISFTTKLDMPDPMSPLIVRRWDHVARQEHPLSDGGILIQQTSGDVQVSVEIRLEDGIVLQFKFDQTKTHFRSGDHWLIPARAAIQDVLWPSDSTGPHGAMFQPARYTEHHYAPIAFVKPGVGGSNQFDVIDLRRNIDPIAKN